MINSLKYMKPLTKDKILLKSQLLFTIMLKEYLKNT